MTRDRIKSSKSILTVLLLVTSILLISSIARSQEAPDRGDVLRIQASANAYRPGDKVGIKVLVSNFKPYKQKLLVVVNIVDTGYKSTIYDSHQCVGTPGQDEATGDITVEVNPYEDCWVGPFYYRIPPTISFGTYHVLVGLRDANWDPVIRFRGASWCQPAASIDITPSAPRITSPKKTLGAENMDVMPLVEKLSHKVRESFSIKQGYVSEVKNDQVYINIGSNNEVYPGMEFEVVRPGSEIRDPVSNKVLGRTEEKVGSIRVERTRSNYSICTILTHQGLYNIQNRDMIIQNIKKLRIAIMDFEDKSVSGDLKRLCSIIADSLTGKLITINCFDIVERKKLRRIIEEQQFQMSDLASPEKARKVGTILNVDAILTGSIATQKDSYIVNFSLIDVERGRIIAAFPEEIKAPPADTAVYYDIAEPTSKYEKGHSSQGPSKPPETPGSSTFQREEFRITYPYPGIKNWNKSISGVGGTPGYVVMVYIRTNQNHLQGRCYVNSDGTWSISQSWPTKGYYNTLFAELLDERDEVIGRTPRIKVRY